VLALGAALVSGLGMARGRCVMAGTPGAMPAGRGEAAAAGWRCAAAGAGVTAAVSPPDPQLVDRLLALDADAVSAADVREVLGRWPAPQILAFQGSVALVSMRPFAEFLVAMGYPEAKVRHPGDGALSYASFGDSRRIAGSLAWHYERDGLVPLMVGHSQGGVMVMRVLRDLDAGRERPVPVWNPVADAAESRAAVVDPLTGAERAVADLRVPYAAAIGTGVLMRALLGQWELVPNLYEVPDTVEEFTGFFIEGDPFTEIFSAPGGVRRFRATGRARVRNVMLPGDYGHVSAPLAAHLAEDARTRAWVDRFDPRTPEVALPEGPGIDTRNLLHAAHIWHSVKRHWCLGAQRLARAAAATAAPRALPVQSVRGAGAAARPQPGVERGRAS
jgi:hypothetical protein